MGGFSFYAPILPSELVSGIQEHVDTWCLAVSKHTLEDDLYVSWIFWVLSFCDDIVHCPLLYVNSQVSILRMDLKMETIWDSLGTFRSCEELRMFTKHSEVAEGGMLSICYVMLFGCLPLYNLLSMHFTTPYLRCHYLACLVVTLMVILRDRDHYHQTSGYYISTSLAWLPDSSHYTILVHTSLQ